jgi:DNA-binding NarL/FixJ family response regulator
MKILIVDDHALLVEGLSSLLQTKGFDVVGTAADGQEGVQQALRLEPDLVLMDISMPRMDGLAATRLIKAKRPDIKIVMLTTSAENEDLFEAIKSGACGYLLKSTRSAAFVDALQGLEQGSPPFSPGLAARLLEEFSHPSKGEKETSAEPQTLLTERQMEVLRLVASGLTYKQVGEKLALSDHTVRYHMSEIMLLLHLSNRSQVIAYAGKMGIE